VRKPHRAKLFPNTKARNHGRGVHTLKRRRCHTTGTAPAKGESLSRSGAHRFVPASLCLCLTFEAPADRGAVVVLSILEDLVELGGESLGRASSPFALHWRLGIGGFSSRSLAGRSRLSPVLHHDPRDLAKYAPRSASLFRETGFVQRVCAFWGGGLLPVRSCVGLIHGIPKKRLDAIHCTLKPRQLRASGTERFKRTDPPDRKSRPRSIGVSDRAA